MRIGAHQQHAAVDLVEHAREPDRLRAGGAASLGAGVEGRARERGPCQGAAVAGKRLGHGGGAVPRGAVAVARAGGSHGRQECGTGDGLGQQFQHGDAFFRFVCSAAPAGTCRRCRARRDDRRHTVARHPTEVALRVFHNTNPRVRGHSGRRVRGGSAPGPRRPCIGAGRSSGTGAAHFSSLISNPEKSLIKDLRLDAVSPKIKDLTPIPWVAAFGSRHEKRPVNHRPSSSGRTGQRSPAM